MSIALIGCGTGADSSNMGGGKASQSTTIN